jgi:hypothetical protein
MIRPFRIFRYKPKPQAHAWGFGCAPLCGWIKVFQMALEAAWVPPGFGGTHLFLVAAPQPLRFALAKGDAFARINLFPLIPFFTRRGI